MFRFGVGRGSSGCCYQPRLVYLQITTQIEQLPDHLKKLILKYKDYVGEFVKFFEHNDDRKHAFISAMIEAKVVASRDQISEEQANQFIDSGELPANLSANHLEIEKAMHRMLTILKGDCYSVVVRQEIDYFRTGEKTVNYILKRPLLGDQCDKLKTAIIHGKHSCQVLEFYKGELKYNCGATEPGIGTDSIVAEREPLMRMISTHDIDHEFDSREILDRFEIPPNTTPVKYEICYWEGATEAFLIRQ